MRSVRRAVDAHVLDATIRGLPPPPGRRRGSNCAGLLDEILVFFAPLLLGAGTRMFAATDAGRIDLVHTTDDPAHWYCVRR
jgi:hypothetical protein